MAASCVYTDTDNHSDDLLEVWHGSTRPTYICGYHEQRHGIPQGAARCLIAEQHAAIDADGPVPLNLEDAVFYVLRHGFGVSEDIDAIILRHAARTAGIEVD